MLHPKPKTLMLWIGLSILTSGCEEESACVAREAADRQAQQNTAMAELNKEVASGTHQLVEADAQARKEIVGVHRDLLQERTRLDSSWNDLEMERRQIAGQRRTESMLVPVAGALLLILVLRFCWYALIAARTNTNSGTELSELLIAEMLSDDPPALRNRPTVLGSARPVETS